MATLQKCWGHLLTLLCCRDMVSAGAPLAEPFKGKRLLGALAGHSITRNTQARQNLLEEASRLDIPILLSNGMGFSSGDGCSKSPSGPNCCASSSSKPKRHVLSTWLPSGCTKAGMIKASIPRSRLSAKHPRIFQQHACTVVGIGGC